MGGSLTDLLRVCKDRMNASVTERLVENLALEAVNKNKTIFEDDRSEEYHILVTCCEESKLIQR